MSVQVGNTSTLSNKLHSPSGNDKFGERKLSIHERLHSEHTERELRKKELSDAYYNQLGGGEKTERQKLQKASSRHRSSRSNVSDGGCSESSQRRVSRGCREEQSLLQ